MATVMSVSALTGCSGGATGEKAEVKETTAAAKTEAAASAETAAKVEETVSEKITFPLAEPISFTCMAMANGTDFKVEENLAWQTLMEYGNMKADVTNLYLIDYVEKIGLTMAGGDYPDVFFKANVDVEEYGVQQGILIPLEDLIREHAPNLTAILDEEDAWAYITASDGHVYALPGVQPMENPFQKYWINQTWMDRLGLEDPKNWDEWYDVFKAFKEQDANGNGDSNDEIPFSTSVDRQPQDMFLLYTDYPYNLNYRIGLIEDEVQYIPTNQSMYEVLDFCRRLYADGLMDKNSLTNTRDQHIAVGMSGDVYGSFFRGAAYSIVGEERSLDYVTMMPFQEGTYARTTPVTGSCLSITDKCEYPEEIIALFDYLYTEEGGILAWLGVEGKTFEYTDAEGHWAYILDENGNDYTTSHTLYGSATFPAKVPDAYYMSDPELNAVEAHQLTQIAKPCENGFVWPAIVFAEDEYEELATLQADINPYITQYSAEVISGQKSLADTWDEYLATMNAMGAERIAEILKQAYAKSVAE